MDADVNTLTWDQSDENKSADKYWDQRGHHETNLAAIVVWITTYLPNLCLKKPDISGVWQPS